ncbi:MAG: glycosyl hydrolase family 95 catalytic domain-containing protein [Thermoguttaceae bacterium]
MKRWATTGLLLVVLPVAGIRGGSAAQDAGSSAPAPPFPAALAAAAVEESEITDIQRQALVLGNGDLVGLLWERGGSLCMRLSKNDLWDARVDTSEDAPLMRVDVPGGTWSGGSYPPSWKKPYPQPRCAAVVRIGGQPGEAGAWRSIRAQGEVNEWLRQDGAGVMAIAGKAEASAGYYWGLPPDQVKAYTALQLRLSGTEGARFYVNVMAGGRNDVVATGWKDTPRQEEEVSFAIPADSEVTGLEIYVMTREGKRVENRIRRIELTGPGGSVLVPPGMAEPKIRSARLDLHRAAAELTGPGQAQTSVRVLWDRNVVLIDSPEDVSLEEIRSKELPAAELGETGGVKWLWMKMPGDLDWPGMEYAVAVAARGARKAVAVVTSLDTKEPVRDAAIRMARETVGADGAALIADHEHPWNGYWSASGVELDDPDFQPWWYRMVYYLRCFARPGAVPTGLFAGLATDSTPWHGDYHHNYNAWQPYWTPFVINHPELADPWIRYMNEMLPRMQWLARTTYDCEGAVIGISSFAFEPDPAKCRSVNCRQIAIPPFGYTLGMAGMSAQVLWHSHLYQPDRKRLEEKVYPVVREVALFYCELAEKCPRDESGHARFGPSYSPEHGKFGVSNVPFDLAYARFMLAAAISAAQELGRDGKLAERFGRALELLPPYPTASDEAGRPIVVDWTGCKFRQIPEHNITVPAVPVFPGEQVTWFSPEPEKELFRNTLQQIRHRGCNSTIMLSVAKARLSMPEAREDARRYYASIAQPNGMFFWPMHGYYLSESVGMAAMISEFLLQSVGDTIRVFPCWPADKDARFANLRAQGGFLVTAGQKGGKVTGVEILSTVGGKLRLVSPWTGQIVERETKAGERVELKP